MGKHLLSPVGAVDYQVSRLFLETRKSFFETFFGHSRKVFIDLILAGGGSADDIFFKIVKDLLASHFDLGFKTNVEILVNQSRCQLLLHFVVHGFIVLVSKFIIVREGVTKNLSASFTESLHKLLLTLLLKLVALTVYEGNSLIS